MVLNPPTPWTTNTPASRAHVGLKSEGHEGLGHMNRTSVGSLGLSFDSSR